jgi:pyrroloquinoline quinone biosynthesis protein E
MKEPCKGCPRAEIDFGGCRCQAMAFTGDPTNTDPACKFSPHHAAFVAAAEAESGVANPPNFLYRRLGGAKGGAASADDTE